MPLNFAARGFRYASRLQQDDGVHGHFVSFDHRLRDGRRDFVGRRRTFRPFKFGDVDQPLFSIRFHRERRPAAIPEGRVARLGRLLDVLRIQVTAAEDDEVLDPAGHVQLPVVHEAEIARAKKWAFV